MPVLNLKQLEDINKMDFTKAPKGAKEYIIASFVAEPAYSIGIDATTALKAVKDCITQMEGYMLFNSAMAHGFAEKLFWRRTYVLQGWSNLPLDIRKQISHRMFIMPEIEYLNVSEGLAKWAEANVMKAINLREVVPCSDNESAPVDLEGGLKDKFKSIVNLFREEESIFKSLLKDIKRKKSNGEAGNVPVWEFSAEGGNESPKTNLYALDAIGLTLNLQMKISDTLALALDNMDDGDMFEKYFIEYSKIPMIARFEKERGDMLVGPGMKAELIEIEDFGGARYRYVPNVLHSKNVDVDNKHADAVLAKLIEVVEYAITSARFFKNYEKFVESEVIHRSNFSKWAMLCFHDAKQVSALLKLSRKRIEQQLAAISPLLK